MDIRIRTTKAACREALIELMATKPFEDITISALCEEANISRKTFYMHYQNLTSVIEDIGEEFYQQFSKIFRSAENKDYEMRFVVRDINAILMDHRGYYSKIATGPSHHEFHKVVEHAFSKIVSDVCKCTYGITSPNLQYYSTFYASGLISLYGNWFRNSNGQSIDDLTRIIERCCFIGADAFINEEKNRLNP